MSPDSTLFIRLQGAPSRHLRAPVPAPHPGAAEDMAARLAPAYPSPSIGKGGPALPPPWVPSHGVSVCSLVGLLCFGICEILLPPVILSVSCVAKTAKRNCFLLEVEPKLAVGAFKHVSDMCEVSSRCEPDYVS